MLNSAIACACCSLRDRQLGSGTFSRVSLSRSFDIGRTGRPPVVGVVGAGCAKGRAKNRTTRSGGVNNVRLSSSAQAARCKARILRLRRDPNLRRKRSSLDASLVLAHHLSWNLASAPERASPPRITCASQSSSSSVSNSASLLGFLPPPPTSSPASSSSASTAARRFLAAAATGGPFAFPRPAADGFGLPVVRNATSNDLRTRRGKHAWFRGRTCDEKGGGAWRCVGGGAGGCKEVAWRTVRGCHEDLLSASCLGRRWADGKRR